MRVLIFVFFLSQIVSCQANGQKNDAANVMNMVDSLTETLGPPANDLVTYFKTFNVTTEKYHDYKTQNSRIDSLIHYYDALTSVYDHAIQLTKASKSMSRFPALKKDFIALLSAGQESWVAVIPVYIKMLRYGGISLNEMEKNRINNAEEIFRSSAAKAYNYGMVVATHQDELEKKYHLKLYNGKYR